MEQEIFRGGFQNRDVGLSQFGDDFGPEYGMDFAILATPTPGFEDAEGRNRLLQDKMVGSLAHHILMRAEGAEHVEVFVKNGILFLQGPVHSDVVKSEIEDQLRELPGLSKIINVLTVR